MNIWDFGGQYKYRSDYLDNFSEYFDGVYKTIFVIDIQDIKRYEEALNYLKDIVGKIIEELIELKLSIFLHKYDPYLKNRVEFKDIDEIIEEQLINKIKAMIPDEIYYEIYKTSIFTTFKKILVI